MGRGRRYGCISAAVAIVWRPGSQPDSLSIDFGVSQGRLGRHLGVTFSHIQKYEKGMNRIGSGRLYQIATYLGVAPGHFFEGLGASSARGKRRPPTAACGATRCDHPALMRPSGVSQEILGAGDYSGERTSRGADLMPLQTGWRDGFTGATLQRAAGGPAQHARRRRGASSGRGTARTDVWRCRQNSTSSSMISSGSASAPEVHSAISGQANTVSL